MLATGDRQGFQLRGLVDRAGHAPDERRLRSQVSTRLRVLRRLAIFGAVVLGLLIAAPIVQVFGRDGVARRARVMRLMTHASRLLLRAFNINCQFVDITGRAYSGHDRLLLVANHLSYLDVVVIAAHIPAVFITSREIEATPVLGGICKASGCLFVERRRMTSVHVDIDQLTTQLGRGANVMLFPEGSTSDGSTFLRFKSTLVEAAIRSRAKVQPLSLRYLTVDGEPFGERNRDNVAWYGDMAFFPHLVRLLSTRRIDCELVVLPQPTFRAHNDRKQLTTDIKRSIGKAYYRDL